MDKKLDFIRAIESLKTIERFNKTSNLDRAESSAEHTWHLVMIVYTLADNRKELNKWKAVEIALVHDLVEIYAGDVKFWDEGKKSVQQIRKAEEESARRLFSLLPKQTGKYFFSLWEEYENRKTKEAKFVYALDKLQPLLQRVVAHDNGWKEKQVDIERLSNSKPQLIKDDNELSQIWDELVKEAEEKGLLWSN